MTMLQLSPSVVVAIVSAAVAILFYTINQTSNQEQDAVLDIINYWNQSISSPQRPFKNLVIGVNSNVDVIVPGVALLRALDVSPGKRINHESLDDLSQLQETFSYYLARGSAAERPFSNQDLYHKIIKAAESLNQIEYFVGGNAALIAKKASELFPNLKIHFVGAIGPLLKKLMPKSIEINQACHVAQDEVHLIMEYKVGEVWGESKAPVATRFVTSFDETNAQMLMMEPLFSSIQSSNFELMVLSGLHMLESQPPEFFRRRIDELATLLNDVPQSTASHLELASMTNQVFVKTIFEKVLPNANSLGLNEQELIFASKSCGGPHHDIFDIDHHSQPEVHKIADILLWIMQKFGYSKQSNQSSRLTRIHFHSLTFHLMAVIDTAWTNSDSAVGAGAQVAGLQACDTNDLNKDIVNLKVPTSYRRFSGDSVQEIDSQKPVVSWKKDGISFIFSPVLVCKHPVKTVGLGDAISATGLMFSQFNSLL